MQYPQTFEDFRRLAKDDSLSPIERVGFPKEYREGKEELIFQDIVRKVSNLSTNKHRIVLDIGCGCSTPASRMIELCRQQNHFLVLVDSQEMLDRLPDDDKFNKKVPARFPKDCENLFDFYRGFVDAIVVYSVLQYVYAEDSVYEFVNRCLELLDEGGQLLLGDIPNDSKRKRFFDSPSGIRFHQEFTGTSSLPPVRTGGIDDDLVLSLVAMCRARGFDAYILPQPPELPMANRREDILVCRP